MKKLLILLALVIFPQFVFSQKDYKQLVDEAIARKGKNLFINADKTLLEPGESARLSIGILVYPANLPGDENVKLELPDEEILPPDNAVYKATNWKILQGGGNLVGIDETTQNYTAPAKLPLDKTAVISVDLMPLKGGLPKVVLLQTIYFTQNETAFTLNMPQLGIVNEKYISKPDSGATVPQVSPQAAKNLPPEARKKISEAQKKMDAVSMEIDLSLLSSNSVAFYDKAQEFMTVRFSALKTQLQDGKTAASSTPDSILAFNFNGKDLGKYQIGAEKTGLGFLNPAKQGFGCGDTNSDSEKIPCRGTISIDYLKDKTMKGTVRVLIYTSVGDEIYRGIFYGKFTANRAN